MKKDNDDYLICECGNKSFKPICAKEKPDGTYEKGYDMLHFKGYFMVGYKCAECGIEYTLFREQIDY